MKKKIIWETKSPKLYNLIKEKKIKSFYSGGNLYNYDVFCVLSKHYNVWVNKSKVKKNKEFIFFYFIRNIFSNIKKCDFIISDPYSFVMNLLPVYKKQIIILHHIDIAKAKTNILQKFFNIALLYKVKRFIRLSSFQGIGMNFY